MVADRRRRPDEAATTAWSIVTGGAQGIGRAIAEGLAAEGATRRRSPTCGGAEEAAAGAAGGDALGLRVDVSREADAAAHGGRPCSTASAASTALVNNAGIYSSLVPQPFEEIDVDEWRKVFDVNVLGMFLATRAVLPQMRAQGGGRIVNIASGHAVQGRSRSCCTTSRPRAPSWR